MRLRSESCERQNVTDRRTIRAMHIARQRCRRQLISQPTDRRPEVIIIHRWTTVHLSIDKQISKNGALPCNITVPCIGQREKAVGGAWGKWGKCTHFHSLSRTWNTGSLTFAIICSLMAVKLNRPRCRGPYILLSGWSALIEIRAFSCVNYHWIYHVSHCTWSVRAFERS